ncbi:g7407 [Coccomyxa elongata]
MRVLKGQVSDPPPGPFDARSTDIEWQNDNGVLNALLPSSRFKDFLAGEESRGFTQYWHRDRNVSDTIEAPSGRSVLFRAAVDIHATAAADSSASAVPRQHPQTAKKDPFYDHAASICKLAHGQLLRLDAASLVESTAALAFISNPDAPAGLSKQRLRPGISPKKKTKGKARVTIPLAAESSPEKPEAAKFFFAQ